MGVRSVVDPPRTADVVVIGGGIVGAATAFHAARAGLRPLLLERRPALCTLTTAVAAGGYRLQLDGEQEFRLVRESVELFLNFEEVTRQRQYGAGLRPQGYLWATTSDAGVERQRRLVERQHGWGVDDVDCVDGDEARRHWPYLAPEVLRVRFREGDGLLDPKAVTFGLAAGSGADVVLRCGVSGFRVREDRLVGVETERGTISADMCVIACGPLSGPLARRAGVELPVETVVRHRVVLPDAPEVPPEAPMTIDDDTAAHWRPAFAGAYLLFTDPSTPPSEPQEAVPVDPGFVFRVLDPASPTSVARITTFWREAWQRGSLHWMVQAGQYTMTPDRLPVLGETPVAGLFVNTGYSGHGVMAGPAGSRHLVDVMTGKVRREENLFGVDRTFEAHEPAGLL